MKRAVILVALFTLLVSCRSGEEQIRDVVKNYLEAEMVHASPHRAYIYLSSADKEHTTVDLYAKDREEKVQLPDATFTIDSVEMTADRANVTVTLSNGPGAEDQETTFVVTEEFDGKHRVYLGLQEIADIRTKLEKSHRLAEDGAIEEAKELVEQVNAAPFRGSRPELYEREIEASKKAVQRRESRKSLDKRMGEALKMNIDDLDQEIKALEKLVPDDDEEMVASLDRLKKGLVERIEVSALENFVFSDVRVRRVPDGWGGIVRTLTFKARNNTKRPLSALKIEIRFVNEAGGKPHGLAEFDLIAKGKVLEKQEVVPFEKAISQTPPDWKGKEIEVLATDLVFADEK